MELNKNPNQKAKDIAKKLNIDRKAINHTLLDNKVKKNKDYSWYPTGIH